MFGLGHDDAIHQNARYPDQPGVQAPVSAMRSTWTMTTPPELRAAVGDRQRFKDQRLLLHRDIAVRVGAGAPQDRYIDRPRLVEQVLLAAECDDFDDILGRSRR